MSVLADVRSGSRPMVRSLREWSFSSASLLLVALLIVTPFENLEAAIPKNRNKVTRNGKIIQIPPRIESPIGAKTSLADFDTAPFPFDGILPGTNARFLNVSAGKRKGHRSGLGRVYWQDETYRERQVLLHIPTEFDVTRPGVIIVFFHGHGAMLGRDVLDRQKVPAQISASGINAVLVAPQFAVDARDSSAGKFWEPGAFNQFVREATIKLAKLHGDPRASQAFTNMPVVIVAYSGGYLATAWCLKVGGAQNRIRGVVLLDALYGEVDKFAAWIAKNRSTFFVSAYTDSTQKNNAALKSILARQKITYGTDLKQQKWQIGVTFLSTNSRVGHWNFVTQAWADYPIKDLLSRLDEYRR
jgi:hypothetical protein